MANLNTVTLVGRLMEEPRVYGEDRDKSVSSIIVVVNEYYRDRDRKLVKKTDSFKVKLYGQPADYAAVNLGKGSLVMVSGRLRTEKWTDRSSGEIKRNVVVVVDEAEGLQGLAKPGHEVGDDDDEVAGAAGDEGGSVGVDGKPEASKGVDAGSKEFEEQHGIQPVPF